MIRVLVGELGQVGDEARRTKSSGVNIGTVQEERVRMFVFKVTSSTAGVVSLPVGLLAGEKLFVVQVESERAAVVAWVMNLLCILYCLASISIVPRPRR